MDEFGVHCWYLIPLNKMAYKEIIQIMIDWFPYTKRGLFLSFVSVLFRVFKFIHHISLNLNQKYWFSLLEIAKFKVFKNPKLRKVLKLQNIAFYGVNDTSFYCSQSLIKPNLMNMLCYKHNQCVFMFVTLLKKKEKRFWFWFKF